jgi:hypothetical protein
MLLLEEEEIVANQPHHHPAYQLLGLQQSAQGCHTQC